MSVQDMKTSFKLKSWKSTLNQLMAETGLSLKDICEYTGSAYNEDNVAIYVKLPRKRTTFIGVGMAFHQPLDVINNWIVKYGNKRKLYIKDISEDLVWMYLIKANCEDPDSGINYFQRYDDYQSAAYSIFCEKWDEIVYGYEDTADVEISLGQAEMGPEYDGLKKFVAEHMDAFKTAYCKPRTFLDIYVGKIIEVSRRNTENKTIKSLNSMRGYLDDSMINFLSGSSETINVIDRNTGKRTISIKHIPKGRKKYISLCISLGMSVQDINYVLSLMGYAELDKSNQEEETLIMQLDRWESNHPMQRKFKNKYCYGDESIELSDPEEFKAVDEMLQMKSELIEAYNKKGYKFIY